MPVKDTCNGWLETLVNSSNFCDLISLSTVESPFSETFLAEPCARVRGWQWWRILFLRDFECPRRGDEMNFLALLSRINSTHFTSTNGQHGAVWLQLFFFFNRLIQEIGEWGVRLFSSLLLVRLEHNSYMSHYCVQLYLRTDFPAHCTKLRLKMPREATSYMNSLTTDSTVSRFTELYDSSHYS